MAMYLNFRDEREAGKFMKLAKQIKEDICELCEMMGQEPMHERRYPHMEYRHREEDMDDIEYRRNRMGRYDY